MKIADQNVSTGILRQNILEKANAAFSGNNKVEDFSKKNLDIVVINSFELQSCNINFLIGKIFFIV